MKAPSRSGAVPFVVLLYVALSQVGCPAFGPGDDCSDDGESWCDDNVRLFCHETIDPDGGVYNVLSENDCASEMNTCVVVRERGEAGLRGFAACVVACDPSSPPICPGAGEPWQVCAPFDSDDEDREAVAKHWQLSGALPPPNPNTAYSLGPSTQPCSP